MTKKKPDKKTKQTWEKHFIRPIGAPGPAGPSKLMAKGLTKRRRTPSDVNGLPNTFQFAADSLKTMSKCGGSASSIVVKKYKKWNFKLIYALVMNTVKNLAHIQKVISLMKLEAKFPGTEKFLLEILVGDLLFGKGLTSVSTNTTAAQLIDLKDAIDKIREKNEAEFKTLCTTETEGPKYLRINCLKTTKEHVLNQLKGLGFKQLEYSKEKIKFKKFITKFKAMPDNEYMLDFHFPDDLILLRSNASRKLKSTDLISGGKAIFQDKASFMAVEALGLQSDKKQVIVDACCAPGGKTAAIASKIKNKGKIFGFDVDKARLAAAQHLVVKKLGVSCIKFECQDFTKVKLTRLAKNSAGVEKFDAILIDPSCSGLGITGRVDYTETRQQQGRLKKLQAFQVSLLKHALVSNKANSIVYCTCSSSVEENEQVVEMALNESGKRDEWQVSQALPYWPNRGESGFEFSENCVRSDSSLLTNGFFIARLVRNENDVKNNDDETIENDDDEEIIE